MACFCCRAFSGGLQLDVAIFENLLVSPIQLVCRCHIANGAIHLDLVFVKSVVTLVLDYIEGKIADRFRWMRDLDVLGLLFFHLHLETGSGELLQS